MLKKNLDSEVGENSNRGKIKFEFLCPIVVFDRKIADI